MNYINDLAKWYFTRRALPLWGILLIDNAIVFGSYFFMYLLFNKTERTFSELELVTLNILLLLVFYNIGFRCFRTYSGILRYSSFIDLRQVGYSMLLGSLLSFGVHCIAGDRLPITGTHILAVFITGTFLLWIIRIMVKIFYDVVFMRERAKRTYIFGV
ncbi:MAG: polysaccharide biosynthesis protein, partial [Prevotella sp.]|nr:polysaccharide biosynthesis protein [Prevotella sp.]